jgi:hypothetical protein
MDASPSRAAREIWSRPMSSGLAVAVACVTILTCGVASPAIAFTHVITVDQRAVVIPLDDVAAEVLRTCATSEDVTLKVQTPGGNVSQHFWCSTAKKATVEALAHRIANALSVRDGAGRKADRIIALRTTFFPEWGRQDRDSLVWSVATGNSVRCTRDLIASKVRRDMASAARAGGESSEHWTLVEAVDLAGFCPERLPGFYATVRRVGEPAAAKAVKARLDAVL